MKAILIKDLAGTGKAGDMIEVKAGYFNNYLLANGYAIKATPAAMKKWEAYNKRKRALEAKNLAEAEELKEKIEGLELKMKAKAGAEGRLYGSITSQNIADELSKKLSCPVDKKKIELEEPIKKAGVSKVPVRVFTGLTAELKVNVIPEYRD